MIVAITFMPQPHPARIRSSDALVDQVNDAPESVVSELSSLVGVAVRNIGMKPAMKIAGNFRGDGADDRSILAVSVYPGATVEIPRMAPRGTPILLANPGCWMFPAQGEPGNRGVLWCAMGLP